MASDPAQRYTAMPAGRRWRHVLHLVLLLVAFAIAARLWSSYLVPRFPASPSLPSPPF